MTDRELLEKFEAPQGSRLIETYKNGNIKIETNAPCDRCGGEGVYFIGVNNGQPVPSWVDNGVCFKCLGTGRMSEMRILMTPENRKKADARAKRREAKIAAEIEKKEAEREAKRQAEIAEQERREAEIAERKAQSSYFGQIGERVTLDLVLVASPSWEQKTYAGFGTELMHCHILQDAEGNTFTWKTANSINVPLGDYQYKVAEPGDKVKLTGTIKEHTEYKGEKQTVLTRCKTIEIEEFEKSQKSC